MESYFEKLNKINVSDKTEKKNGLTYLSWAWAWGELKKQDTTANYKVYENEHGWNYFTDGRTCWVKVGVTTNASENEAVEHIEYLPVMDSRNKSIPLESVTSFDVNKAIQRALTKAIARHGLGLYIYAGEDLPEGEDEKIDAPSEEQVARLTELGGSLKVVATYYKKAVEEVTAADVQAMIVAKEKALAKNKKKEKEGENND